MRWSLETALSRDGHAVRSVDSGKAALDAAGSGNYRVVITDYCMEELDGLDLLWLIKTQTPQTHVIVITAHATPQLERFARAIGAFDFFEKPFEFTDLRQAVGKATAAPERRKGPRGCCGNCAWHTPCDQWSSHQGWKAKREYSQ
jgi:DNA-binding NtrC family response regulator